MALSDLHQASIVSAAYEEILANLLFGLVEARVIPPELAGEIVRRGKEKLASFPLDGLPLVETAHTGLERLAQQLETTEPLD